MTPVIYALPFDPTRLLPRNRVLREYHDLSRQAGLTYRTLVLNHGYFYTEHVEVTDSAGYNLVQDEDYQCVSISAEGGVETGFEMAAVIVITNPRVTHEVYINASMVGGKYCDVTPAIADMSAGLLNPTRNPTWRNITGKPDEFEVGGHLHAMWETYGYEGFCEAIDRITIAKLAVSARTYQQVEVEFDGKMDILDAELTQLLADLAVHLATKNPHKVTKAQVGLSDVQNYSVITDTEAGQRGFNSPSRYLTVARFKKMLDVNFVADMDDHINNTNNPHQVTAAQAGTLTYEESAVELAKVLNKDANAYATSKLQGYDWNALQNYARTNLNANNITSGVVSIRRLTNAAVLNAEQIIVGDNQVVNIKDLINQYAKKGTKMVYLQGANGANVAAVLASTYSDPIQYPPGTLALIMVYSSASFGYGNTSDSYQAWRLQCWVKVDNVNWQAL